ncbi:MAG: ABC transporter substrate-binding protein [Deltaproteobacteria bacterium]|nr:ABC transporter substrate-binding protein [Deltaproteobacteria bacterium]
MSGEIFKRLGKRPLCLIALGIGLLLQTSLVNAQSSRKIIIGLSTINGSSAILSVAHKTGLFERYGLQDQIVYFNSGTIAASALLSGDVKISLMSANSTLGAAIGGADVVQIGGLTNKLAYGLMVSPSIKSLQELKGYNLGIAGFGGASDFAANYVLRKEGILPGKDVILLSVGGHQERLTALVSGKLKAVLVQPPFTKRAEKAGFRRLVDFSSLDLEFQELAYTTTRSYLKADREACLNFLKAVTEATYFFKSHKNETKTILAAFLKTEDQDALEEAYTVNARSLIPEVPYSSLKGLQNTLEVMAFRNPKAKDKDPREVIDDSLVKEMERSGFIAHLRKTYPVPSQQ